VGPLIHPRQLDRVDGYVSRAVAAGAHPLIGGGPHPLGGLYYQPTILDGMAPDAEIVTDEVFGPVLTWQTFTSEDEALELANATRYGLAAVVFTRDRARAERVAAGIVAGTVWVNCWFVRDLAAPFGGARQSGTGREGGTWSFDFFSDVKNVALRRGSFADDSIADVGGHGPVAGPGDGAGPGDRTRTTGDPAADATSDPTRGGTGASGDPAADTSDPAGGRAGGRPGGGTGAAGNPAAEATSDPTGGRGATGDPTANTSGQAGGGTGPAAEATSDPTRGEPGDPAHVTGIPATATSDRPGDAAIDARGGEASRGAGDG
jgi:hypothetical protein